MSASKVEELDADEEVCASCGIAAVDDITLKFCDDCDLVKYCSDECQKNHRPQHKKACKKRLAELHGKHLFSQPDSSYLGECPLCCLPLSIDLEKSIVMGCCSKTICMGCCYANMKREAEAGLEHRCAFCREPEPKSGEEILKQVLERVKKNDPDAMTEMGRRLALKGDFEKVLEYWTKAAELECHVDAHRRLGTSYFEGKGVEKDEKKAAYHLEQAAIGGHPQARGYLAALEMKNDRFERAAKHLIINANLGCNLSLEHIKELFVDGIVSKDEYAAALRGHQAAVNETKSAERDEGESFYARK